MKKTVLDECKTSLTDARSALDECRGDCSAAIATVAEELANCTFGLDNCRTSKATDTAAATDAHSAKVNGLERLSAVRLVIIAEGNAKTNSCETRLNETMKECEAGRVACADEHDKLTLELIRANECVDECTEKLSALEESNHLNCVANMTEHQIDTQIAM